MSDAKPMLATTVQSILHSRLDDTEDGESRCEALERLIPEHGWSAVLSELLEVLRGAWSDDEATVAAEVLWGAALDGRDMPTDRVVAHIVYRWPSVAGPRENNLAWSIVAKLKREDYLSEYRPEEDPGVRRELAKLPPRPAL